MAAEWRGRQRRCADKRRDGGSRLEVEGRQEACKGGNRWNDRQRLSAGVAASKINLFAAGP
jgi:hypothetical protein